MKKVVFLFCVDGLTGFRQAIEAAFPNAQIHRCNIHQIRSSTRFLLLSVDLLCKIKCIHSDDFLSNLGVVT
ncbi:MAG TPA: hypothetical protein DHV76_01895 [Ruminococcaceae bacterium]|nr:hypothetical protein [Oscillospiraceae bacterium]